MSSDSSSPTRRLSPPTKHSRFGSRHVPRESSSSEGSARSPRTRLLRRSRSPVGSLLDNHPCRFAGNPRHLIGSHDDHPGAVSRPLHSGAGPPIVIVHYRPPGHLHLKDIGPAVCLHPICAPGLPAGITFLDRTRLTIASYAGVRTMETNIHVIPVTGLINNCG